MRTAILFAALLAATPGLAADPWMKSFPIRMGTHVLTAQGPSGRARLLLDGKVIEGQQGQTLGFLLDWIGNVDAIPTVALMDNQGGASCVGGAEIVIAAPPGKPPVIDRVPTLGCNQEPKVSEVSDRLVIVIPADTSQEGSIHLFDGVHGLWKAADLPKIEKGKLLAPKAFRLR